MAITSTYKKLKHLLDYARTLETFKTQAKLIESLRENHLKSPHPDLKKVKS